MMIVTGGAGFIGSALVWKLNGLGIRNVFVVDRMGQGAKWRNLAKRHFVGFAHKDAFSRGLAGEGLPGVSPRDVEAVFHLGASSSTVETDVDYLMTNNFNYSVQLWRWCVEHRIPFIYASSAATYGDGLKGFDDSASNADHLVPLNPYGFSKQKFDQWALAEAAVGRAPPFWAGLKFFNVYGPQEYHKGGQASVVAPFLRQLRETGSIRLFKSHHPKYGDGLQKRDFIYVKDCVDIMWHLFSSRVKAQPGLYNVGTGQARTWLDLATAVAAAVGEPASKKSTKPAKISASQRTSRQSTRRTAAGPSFIRFIDMPESLRDQYQYHTEANLERLRSQGGYTAPLTKLEDGIRDYVKGYLLGADLYL